MAAGSGRTSVGVLALLAAGLGPQVAGAVTVWYNGDMSSAGSGFTNRYGAYRSLVYEDLVVGQYGWVVTSVWSNNTTSRTGISQAYWEIRSGVSEGEGGLLLYHGLDTATQTDTGRQQPAGVHEYKIEVVGLKLVLAPGTYWLAVAPYLVGADPLCLGERDRGLNAVGTPQGNNGQSFYIGTGGYDFKDMSDQWGWCGTCAAASNVHWRP